MSMENPPTEMQRLVPDGETIGAEHALSGTSARERLPHYADRYYLTPLDEATMGIRDDEVYGWVRIERFWEEKEGMSRQLQFVQEHPGARVPLDKYKRPRTNDDLILMAYPRAIKEENDRIRQEAYQAWVDEIESGEHEEPKDSDGVPMKDQTYLRARARRMHQDNKRSGITGNTPTSGQSLEDVYSRMTVEAVEAEEARYRGGARQRSFTGDDWGKYLDSAAKMGRPPEAGRKERGKVHSMGDSGFPRKGLNISGKGKGD